MSLSLAGLTLTMALAGQGESPASGGGACALLPALRDGLNQRFGSSRVLTAAELYDDERGLFNADHPGACPGVRTGRFFGSKERAAIALVLLDVGEKKEVRLVVARPALSAWTFHEVESLEHGSTPVVLKATSPSETERDLVVLKGYESWERAYRWNGRAFELLKPRD